MTIHARLSPSAAHRWMRCPGSVALEAALPESSSAYADEGTKAHEIAADWLSGDNPPPPIDGDEMRGHVATYVDYVLSLAKGHELLVEQRVDFSDAIGVADSFGTSDAVILAGDELILCDLKYGRGVKVDAEFNEQLQLYALGALSTFGMVQEFKTVRMCIIQPRLDHISEWVRTVEDLAEFAEAARNRAAVALSPDAPCFPGEKQCRFCKVKAHCPALASKVYDEVVDGFDDLTQSIEAVGGMTDLQTLAGHLADVDLIETWCEAVRKRAYTELAEGRDVPGFKLVQGRAGARKWSNEQEAETKLKSMRLKIEEMYDLSLISPTTAEKLAKSGTIGPRQWPALQSLISRAEGKPSVAPQSDKRPAISLVARADDFEAVA